MHMRPPEPVLIRHFEEIRKGITPQVHQDMDGNCGWISQNLRGRIGGSITASS